MTADEMIAGWQSNTRRDTAVQTAEAWLSTYLSLGPRPAKEGYEVAASMGISPGPSCAQRKPSVCTARKRARYGIGLLQQHILAVLTLLALLALLPRSPPKPPKNANNAKAAIREDLLETNNDMKMAKNAKSAKVTNGALALLEECRSENPGDRAE
jgi:hypothetical protein